MTMLPQRCAYRVLIDEHGIAALLGFSSRGLFSFIAEQHLNCCCTCFALVFSVNLQCTICTKAFIADKDDS
jgi:hypothetical protein